MTTTVQHLYVPRGLGRGDAARYIGISTTKFDELVMDGRMPRPKKVDRRKIWDRNELDQAFDELPNDEIPNEWDMRLQ